MKKLLPFLLIALMVLAIPIVKAPDSPPGQDKIVVLPYATLVINNGTVYNITNFISNYYQNVSYTNETIVYNIDNRTLITENQTFYNVNREIVNQYFITNYNVDLTPIWNEIVRLWIEVKDIDSDLDRDETIIALLGLAFLALCGGVIYHIFYANRTKSKPHKTVDYYELEEKDTDGSCIRFYKVIEE